MTRTRTALVASAAVVAALWAWNTSWLASAPAQGARWIAHRGVHQSFPPAGIDGDTCTATRIRPIAHGFVENTLPSMRAAFEAGAAIVEVDLHQTADGRLAVFHDAGLECRTDGTGAPEDHDMAKLKSLDVAWGYSADGGATFPLRGTGRGAMPELSEVLAAFPEGGFVFDLKRGNASDGELLADALATRTPEQRARYWVYGGEAGVARVRERLPDVRTFDRGRVKACLVRYLAWGWTGAVPAACRDTVVLVPINGAWLLWGYPNRLLARMERAGSEVVLIGPWSRGQRHTTGVDDDGSRALVPEDFGGWVWTNRIEAAGAISPAAPSR